MVKLTENSHRLNVLGVTTDIEDFLSRTYVVDDASTAWREEYIRARYVKHIGPVGEKLDSELKDSVFGCEALIRDNLPIGIWPARLEWRVIK